MKTMKKVLKAKMNTTLSKMRKLKPMEEADAGKRK